MAGQVENATSKASGWNVESGGAGDKAAIEETDSGRIRMRSADVIACRAALRQTCVATVF